MMHYASGDVRFWTDNVGNGQSAAGVSQLTKGI